jgi:hypothetical protein
MGNSDSGSISLRSGIPRLLDQYCAAVESQENRSRLRLWAGPPFHIKTVKFRGQARPLSETGGKVPVQTDLYSTGFWGRVYGFSLAQFYTDPTTYLYYYLTTRLRLFEEIPDDSPLLPIVPVWIRLGVEASIFGAEQVYDDVAEPWVSRKAVISKYEDLDRIPVPDFHRSGLMPLAHRFYEEISEMVRGHGITVQFHDWGTSVLNNMIALRGYDDLMTDMIEEPEFVERLARLVVDARKKWELARSSHVGKPLRGLLLYDDDVNVPQFSPTLYRQFILPCEKELHDFHGSVEYWHSCGNTTPFFPAIKELPRIDMLNVSAWADVRRAVEVFPESTLDICVHAVDDVLQASPDQMERRLRGILETCREAGARSFSIRAEGITGLEEPEQDLRQALQWTEIAQRLTESYSR